jgi:hypothetical protein
VDDNPYAPPRRRILSTVEFDVLWEQLGLGPTPVALQIPSPGRTHRDRAEIVAAGLDGLRRRGLAAHDGPDPELTRLLTLLARPTAQLELRAWVGGSVRAVAAELHDAAVLAVRHESSVSLQACGSLPAGIVSTLPSVSAGPGRAVTLPADVLAAAAGTPQVRTALLAAGVTAGDAGVLARMLDGGRNRGQVVALAADRWGIARRFADVVTVLDTDHGRYLLTRTTAPDGAAWATVAPTDDRRLRGRIGELLSTASDAALAA